MQYIIEIDGPDRRYTYNVYSVIELEDRTFAKDVRIFCSDDKQEFLNFLATTPAQHN